MKEETKILNELTEKQKEFCREYIYDWNGARAYNVAYKKNNVSWARIEACKLLTKPNIKEYIELIQNDIEKVAGISRLRVLNEFAKLAFNSIADLQDDWIEKKEFDKLTKEQKACICEISHQTRTIKAKKKEDDDIEVEYVKIKLHDKNKALENIAKMLGYNAADKLDILSGGKQIQLPPIIIQTASDLKSQK